MEEEITSLKSEVESLRSEVHFWENKCYELEENAGIKDVDFFIWKLKNEGLYTDYLRAIY